MFYSCITIFIRGPLVRGHEIKYLSINLSISFMEWTFKFECILSQYTGSPMILKSRVYHSNLGTQQLFKYSFLLINCYGDQKTVANNRSRWCVGETFTFTLEICLLCMYLQKPGFKLFEGTGSVHLTYTPFCARVSLWIDIQLSPAMASELDLVNRDPNNLNDHLQVCFSLIFNRNW